MKGKLRMFGFVRHMSYITLRKEILLWVNRSFRKLGDVFISSDQETLVWQTVHSCLLLVFSWRLRFLRAKIIVYVNKATEIIRETFQYARKVGCVRKHEEWNIHSKNTSLFIVGALGLRYCARAFSSCGEWGCPRAVLHGLLNLKRSISCCGAQAPGRAGLRGHCTRAQQLWPVGSGAQQAWHTGVVALRRVGASRARGAGVPGIARWILNHWTTKEARKYIFLKGKAGNFILELVASGRKNKGQLIWTQKVVKGLQKEEPCKRSFMYGQAGIRWNLTRQIDFVISSRPVQD